MNWHRARRILTLGKSPGGERRLGPSVTSSEAHLSVDADVFGVLRAESICVVSGKGGTGKSIVTASLARLLARGGRTLLLDADLGVGNAHIMQDVCPERSFVDVVEERCELRDILCHCAPGLDLLAGGSGYARMAGLSEYELQRIAQGLEKLELEYDYVVVDSAAGISNQTVAFAAAADIVLLVTTPDVTAMTDAYAFFKVLLQQRPAAQPLLVVNRAAGDGDARSVARRIASVSQKFLGREPRWVGSLLEDRAAFRSVQRRTPVVESEPASILALALEELTETVLGELSRNETRGLGRTLLRYSRSRVQRPA